MSNGESKISTIFHVKKITFSRAGGSPANDTETTSGEADDKLPLISLVICKSSL